MAVTKRTRFEVLRRDNHACRYCGATAATSPLTVDHVVPRALGGGDSPANLVAACKDCNAGKSSSSPDEALVAQINEDAVRWAAARKRAVELVALDRRARKERVAPLVADWRLWDKDLSYLPHDYEQTVTTWLDAGLTIDQIIEAQDIALANEWVKFPEIFRYMAGIARNWIADLDQKTHEILTEGADR